MSDALAGDDGAPPFVAEDHDHESCVETAVTAAGAVCEQRGERLTPLRRRVLELVWASHSPVGAYDLMERLGRERGRVAPPTIYRALDFLCQQRLVHRIDSLNAFVGCAHPGRAHAAYFMICRRCRAAAEIVDPDLRTAMAQSADRAGFLVEGETVELHGVCPHCRADASGILPT
jgi:Fur family transcriptional regulator, zinc uptake regulator